MQCKIDSPSLLFLSATCISKENLVSHEHFTCLAGRTVARTDQYTYCDYTEMTDEDVAEGVLHDLLTFSQHFGFRDGERPGDCFDHL